MPMLRSSWTEMFGFYENRQYRVKGWKSKCADLELNAWECLEAYGYWRGERYCKAYLEDFDECLTGLKQQRRLGYMRAERVKQLKNGERTLDNFWDEKVPKNSWVRGPFQS